MVLQYAGIFRAISRFSVELKTDVSDVSSVFGIRVDVVDDRASLFTTSTLMMKTEEISETLVL
jgi:hypothetical protein